MKESKQYEVLKWASLFLEKHNREQRVAELLLQHFLNVSRSTFFTMMHERVPTHIKEKFEHAIREHARTGVPVQHITGLDVFYGREFIVNEHVLIPRPETEELVHAVLLQVKSMHVDEQLTIVDVGTGSGIIAITLALELPYAKVYATDISPNALQVAKRNAKSLNAPVHFMEGDFLQPLVEGGIQPHIIVSNPPYIDWEEKRALADTVKNFDPELALFSDEEGLASYKDIITQSQRIKKRLHLIAFEIGHEQGSAVCTLLSNAYPRLTTSIVKDINTKERIVLGH
ncbi:peptide chain release factor N(5)-glutamine methyltransferase [Virgibacillus sp. W0430]|uniref:peptide chain release factor N(5)-glutamine methyltransferase n=1 Tax=Virgibacillus sp. W0430 TaxID=3391580 RepID=UPI003F4612B8